MAGHQHLAIIFHRLIDYYQTMLGPWGRPRQQSPRQRPPYYTIPQCYGPPGPYFPNNIWRNGRPNGVPQTCGNGNPLMHHGPVVHVCCPHPSHRRHHRDRRHHSRRGHRRDEDDDDEDDEDDESDSDASIMSEIYDGDSVASQVGNMYGGRMPGFGRRNGHHRGMEHIGRHQPHGPRILMHPGGSPFNGHRGNRVAGMFERDPYRIGRDYEDSEISY